ncbi:MAG: ATP-citrate lyase alpha-subunit [Candidatus Marinamargulisbacteria bacterium]|jgi:ATP-citrate lyase alpha-subunit
MSNTLFTKDTQAIFWNNNTNAIQRMLDYDYIAERKHPSVAAIVHATGDASFQKFFFGEKEVMIPIFRSTEEATDAFPKANTFLNFASFRTAYDITDKALQIPSLKVFMITAEGVPERFARQLKLKAKKLNKVIIGPSTIGGIVPGAFKIGNVGGTIKQILKSKLHKQGSAGVITKSGGLFNELANILALQGNGIAEGVVIGGDRYPGSSYIDHILRMEKNPEVKFIVLLGEVGGTAEYEVIKAINAGKIKKIVVAWCIGTIAEQFKTSVQFGHAGANANADTETARAKNMALQKAGVRVPKSFNRLPEMIRAVFQRLHAEGVIETEIEEEARELPEDYSHAKREGKIRRETNFICTISDDRGEEAVYAGYPISSLATPETGFSISDVITLLWFKKRYPKWASDFIETVIKTVADHGPAVSGAHNVRVSSRAGKDLVSSLASGILTIGPKFGGAIDGAAQYFKEGLESGWSAKEFVSVMKDRSIPIPGIGHRIKSIRNPDLRVEGLRKYAKAHFPSTPHLDYASKVELLTTAKKENLILNVDGCVGVLMVDMWQNLGYTNEEIEQMMRSGTLNAFFVVGRTIGFIGHILDEKRLNMPLYRHHFDDILYDVKKAETIESPVLKT